MYIAIFAVGVLFSFFQSWHKEYRLRLDGESKQLRPDVSAEFKPIGGVDGSKPSWILYLHNSSPIPAVDIHIKDIRHGDKVLRFMPPASLTKDVNHAVGCGILYNGWNHTNDIMSLFAGDNSFQFPSFRLEIRFSNLDHTNRKHWIFSAMCWHEVQQERLVLNGQTIDLFR